MELAAKIFGWLLLLTGISIIAWTLYSSFNIFTAKAVLPDFFQLPEEEVFLQEEATQDIQVQFQKIIGEQLKEVLPVDTLLALFNLIVWSILALILIFGGSQISGLGIKLIKK